MMKMDIDNYLLGVYDSNILKWQQFIECKSIEDDHYNVNKVNAIEKFLNKKRVRNGKK